MSNPIFGNMIGGTAPIKTVTIQDSDGHDVIAVVTDSEVILTAVDDDVTAGKIYVSDNGVSTGTRETPPYYYALIDSAGLCYEVRGTSKDCDNMDGYVAIPKYSQTYIGKYYTDQWSS